jgi:hypothetical protein
MAVFISYSSRDRALLDGLMVALRQAHVPVWLDEELGGGETWWRQILEQIRACEVFIVAVSDHSFDSKPCQAELRYARALGKPILPVQVGSVRSMRVNPLAQMQMIDYQRPSIQTGIQLISAVHARQAALAPLPDPLPDEPAVPFAYLMRLASTIAGPQLSPQEQSSLLSEMKAGLEEDGDDATARADITQLLCQLRDRSDVTYRTRSDVESVLASLGGAVPAMGAPVRQQPMETGPQMVQQPMGSPMGTGPQPIPQPMGPPVPPPAGPGSGRSRPPGGSGRSRTTWLIAAGGGVVAVALVIGLVVWLSGSRTEPTPPKPAPVLTAAQLPSVLLSTEEINSIMGLSNIMPDKVRDHMDSFSPTISDPTCLGAYRTADATVLEAKNPDGRITDYVDQTVVAFPSAEQANAFLDNSADKWQACAGQAVTITDDSGDHHPTFLDVARADSQITQKSTFEGAGGYGCEHSLRTYSNVILEAIACNDHMNDEGTRITDAMAAKISS